MSLFAACAVARMILVVVGVAPSVAAADSAQAKRALASAAQEANSLMPDSTYFAQTTLAASPAASASAAPPVASAVPPLLSAAALHAVHGLVRRQIE